MKSTHSVKTITATELRGNIYQILDEVLNTGQAIEIKKNGRLLRLMPVQAAHPITALPQRDIIRGNPDDLPEISWEQELNLDLP